MVVACKRGNPHGCASELRIDGVVCKESDIEDVLGIRMSHPPLRAPILSRHTLGYLFSASPSDRAAYFRAILDTEDLEDFRRAVAVLESRIVEPTSQELSLVMLVLLGYFAVAMGFDVRTRGRVHSAYSRGAGALVGWVALSFATASLPPVLALTASLVD